MGAPRVRNAELQLLVAPHVSELLSLGVPDRRLERLPSALATVVPPADVELCTRYASLCAELAAVGLPETIQMDDLHDGNVFVSGSTLRVFDWGDASIAHPFVSLPMILATMKQRLEVRDDVAVRRVCDAYLEPFRGFASMAALRSAAALADRVVPTVRILAWQLAFQDAPPEDRTSEWGETLEMLVDQQRAVLDRRPQDAS